MREYRGNNSFYIDLPMPSNTLSSSPLVGPSITSSAKSVNSGTAVVLTDDQIARAAHIQSIFDPFTKSANINQFFLMIWYNPWVLFIWYNFGLW